MPKQQPAYDPGLFVPFSEIALCCVYQPFREHSPILIRDPTHQGSMPHHSTWRKTDTVGFHLRELASRMALIWWQGLSPISGAWTSHSGREATISHHLERGNHFRISLIDQTQLLFSHPLQRLCNCPPCNSS